MIKIFRNILVRTQLAFFAMTDAWDNKEREPPRDKEVLVSYKGVAIGAVYLTSAILYEIWQCVIGVGYGSAKYQSYENTKRGMMYESWLEREGVFNAHLSTMDKYYYVKKLKKALKRRLVKDWDVEPWNKDKIIEDIKHCDRMMEDIYRDAMILGLSDVKEQQ